MIRSAVRMFRMQAVLVLAVCLGLASAAGMIMLEHRTPPATRCWPASPDASTPWCLIPAPHDIGKTAIPEEILAKPGALDSDEWAFIRRHTLIGERIVAAAPSLAHTAALVRSSHERIDGKGYPDGLAGEDIPLGSRIIAVCDAYDAMVAPRPYRNQLGPGEAISELRRCAGAQFDSAVVEAFATVNLEDDLISAEIAHFRPLRDIPAPG